MARDIRSDYLRDPRASMFERMIAQGSSGKPVRHWVQGLANLGSALTGAYMAKKLRGEYEGKEKEADFEREGAIKLAFGQPKETLTYGDTTINWNDQKPNLSAASNMLKSPYNEGLANQLIGQQFNQQNTQANQEFQRQQQQDQFDRNKELLGMKSQQALELEKWKMQQDPIRKILLGPQFTNEPLQSLPTQPIGAQQLIQSQPPQQAASLLAQQGQQPPTVGQVIGQTGGMTAQDAMYNAALKSKGIEAPKGYMYGAPKQQGGQPRLMRVPQEEKETTFTKELAKKDAQLVAKTRGELQSLNTFGQTLNSAKSILENTPSMKLGPIAGRLTQMAGDPQISNLTSDLNSLALQSRTLLQLPASGFSDADRQFLVEVAGGSMYKKEALGKILEKLSNLNEKALSNKQNLINYAEQSGTLSGYRPQTQEAARSVGWDDELTSGETVKLPDGRIVQVP